MVRRGYVRLPFVPLAALVMALASVGPALADDTGPCNVTVDPISAVGGASFNFSGSGFVPTKMSLQKGTGAPIVNDLDLGGADPWQVAVQSRAGDEGTWTASFEAPGSCTASVFFEVVLASTDAEVDVAAEANATNPQPTQPTQPSSPVMLYLLVVGFGFTGGVFLARRLGARPTRLRK